MRKTSGDRQNEHILVCLSSSPSNERIVCTAAQMARAFGGNLTALYVQTPDAAGMNTEDRSRLQANTLLAERLGAEIVTTHGEDVATQIVEYARLSGVTRVIIGRSVARRRHFWSRPTLTERLIELAPQLDIYIIPDAEVYRLRHRIRHSCRNMPGIRDLALTMGLLSAATAVGWMFAHWGFTDANIIAVYLLAVLLTSVFTSGYFCGALASVLSVVLFNFFLTEPHLSLRAYDTGYPVTFAVMLCSALLTGTLAAKLKAHAQLSARDAYRTKILFDTNQRLQKAQSPGEIYQSTAAQLQRLLQCDLLIYPAQNGALSSGILYPADGGAPCDISPADEEREVVCWVWENRRRAGATTGQYSNARRLYLAIRTAQQVYGVIGVFVDRQTPIDAFAYSILLSILGECALALESLRNAEEKEKAAVLAKNEQLRANLLRSISHDLRTPLTSISGNADTLIHNFDALDGETRMRIFTDIYDDAQWLTELVENLLSITKMADGSVKLHLSDQVAEDVVSEAIRHIDRRCSEHPVTTDCGDEPLLIRVDARLIVQVLVNLVNNAIKYTPPGSEIHVAVLRRDGAAVFQVSDHGSGIPDALKELVFEMFFTGDNAVGDSRRSLGLGLALCRAIVHAHGGTISLTDNVPHGCVFSFTVPLSEVNLNE